MILLGLLLFVGPVAAHVALPAVSWLPLVIALTAVIAAFTIRPVRALALFVLFMLFVDTLERWMGDSVGLIDELAVPTMTLITLAMRFDRIRGAFNPIRDGALAVTLLVAVGSSIVADVPAAIWLPGLLLLAKGGLVFYVALLQRGWPQDLVWAAKLFLGAGVVVLALAALELVAPEIVQQIGGGTTATRAGLPALKSAFYHPQLFGWFSTVIALFLFAFYSVFRRRWMLVLGFAFAIGTVLSARRRAIVGLLVGLSLGALVDVGRSRTLLRRRVASWLPVGIGAAALTLVFLPALSGLYQLTIDDYGGAGSPSAPGPGEPTADEEAAGTPARVALTSTGIRIAMDRFPLGAGLGQFGSWISREHYSPVYAEYGLDDIYGLSPQNPHYITDTFWPQILGETGVVGLAGFAVFTGAIVHGVVRTARRADLQPVGVAFTLGTVMLLVQTLVESIASPILAAPSQTYLVMVAAGVSIGWIPVTVLVSTKGDRP